MSLLILFHHKLQDMKYFTLLLLLLFAFKPIFPVLSYAIHYDYIVKELCENKDNIKSDCKGSCHLKKELANASQTEQTDKRESKFPSFNLEVIYFHILEDFNLEHYSTSEKKRLNHYKILYFRLYSTSIFQPPLHF